VSKPFHVPYFNTARRMAYATLIPSEGITKRVVKVFNNGQCHALAVALHKLTGWPIIGFVEPGSGKRIPHHFVVEPQDLLRCNDVQLNTSRYTKAARDYDAARTRTHNIGMTIDIEGGRCTDAICHSRVVTTEDILLWEHRNGIFLPPHREAAEFYAPLLLRSMASKMRGFFSGSSHWNKYKNLFIHNAEPEEEL